MMGSRGLLIGGLAALAVAIGGGGLAIVHGSASPDAGPALGSGYGMTGGGGSYGGDSGASGASSGGYGMMGGSSGGYGMMGQGYGMMGEGYGSSTTPDQSSAKPDRTLQLVVRSDTEHGKRGPDGRWHDAFLPAGFSVRTGETVAVRVANYDDMPHSFTAPMLGLDVTIPKGSATAPGTVTFVFTAPSRAGSYPWWCALPCDSYSMSHDGFMRGYVTVS